MILKFAGSSLALRHIKTTFPQRLNVQVLNRTKYLLVEISSYMWDIHLSKYKVMMQILCPCCPPPVPTLNNFLSSNTGFITQREIFKLLVGGKMIAEYFCTSGLHLLSRHPSDAQSPVQMSFSAPTTASCPHGSELHTSFAGSWVRASLLPARVRSIPSSGNIYLAQPLPKFRLFTVQEFPSTGVFHAVFTA